MSEDSKYVCCLCNLETGSNADLENHIFIEHSEIFAEPSESDKKRVKREIDETDGSETGNGEVVTTGSPSKFHQHSHT
jgi:hypothetical protein